MAASAKPVQEPEVDSVIYSKRRYVALGDSHMHCVESVASGVRLAEEYAQPGVKYARKRMNSEKRKTKDIARGRVADAFLDRMCAYPERSSFLTMPGMHWDLEKQLIGQGKILQLPPPKFECFEHEPSIFIGSLDRVPVRHKRDLPTAVDPLTFRNSYVSAFRCGKIEHWVPKRNIAGAWLDFCGPLSIDRLKLCRSAFDSCDVLVVTFMKGRYGGEMRNTILDAGGTIEAITRTLPVPDDIFDYADGVGMLQLTWGARPCEREKEFLQGMRKITLGMG